MKITRHDKASKGDTQLEWVSLKSNGRIYDVGIINGALRSIAVWVNPGNDYTQPHLRAISPTGRTGISIKTALINARVIV